MKNFQYITAKEAYSNLYYQLPKVLFTSELYKHMSNDSKIAYAMLQDRCEYSIQNNWIDEEGHVYFIYTRDELMNILGCKENKIAKIKKELKEMDLLHEKRTPPQKLVYGKFQNFPNKLYLGKLKVNATDVYHTKKFTIRTDFIESGEKQCPEESHEISISSESGEKQCPEESHEISISSESGKKTPNLYINNNLDTLKEDTKKTDTRKQQQEIYLLKHFAETHEEHSFLTKQNLELIGLFSDTLSDAENMQGIILRAKKEVEKKHDAVLVLDEDYLHDEILAIQEDIRKTLHRIYQKRKTDAAIKNIDNYTYGAFKNLFDQKLGELEMLTAENKSTVATHDCVK